jgi:hypothetical protein
LKVLRHNYFGAQLSVTVVNLGIAIVKLGITAIHDEEDDDLLTLHGEQLTHMVMTGNQIVVAPSKLFVIES